MRARSYARRVARLHAEVFKPTPLRTCWASVGGPWSSYRAFSTPSNITLRLRSRWDAEAGSCCREYVHHVALPSSGSFSLEEPRLFPARVFFRATEVLTHPDRRAGQLVHDHHWPPVSLSPSYPSHSHRVHSSAPTMPQHSLLPRKPVPRIGRAERKASVSDRSALTFQYQGHHVAVKPDVSRHVLTCRRRVLGDVALRAVLTTYVHCRGLRPCMYGAVGSAPPWSSGIGTTPGLIYLPSFLPSFLARLGASGRHAGRPENAYMSPKAACASMSTVRASPRPPAPALASLALGSPPARCAC
jgi:hypothetical protein